jgi:hypothetical protein
MLKLSFACLWSSLLALGSFGCSSRALTPTDPQRKIDASTRPFDAAKSPLDAGTEDAGGCGCQIGSDGVMRMSWSCFMASFNVGSPERGWCGAPGGWSSACGLDVFTYEDQYGLFQRYVYDGSGVQVGAHYENVDTPFGCPDSTLQALKVESGSFPAASCGAVPCACNFERGDGSFTCPAPADASVWQDAAPPTDAGPPRFDAASCDCHIDADGVLRMAWDCFWASYGNGSAESGWCGANGQLTRGCGLDVFTNYRDGLPNLYVYDQNGAQVGLQYQNADVAFVCPVDSTLTSLKVASGRFPPSTCASVVCPCDKGTFVCPAPDASSSDGPSDR